MPDVQVVCAVGCSDGDEPDPSVADQARVDSSRGRVGDVQQRRRSGRGAEGASVCVEERGAGRFVAGGAIEESAAAAGGEVRECSGGIVAEIVIEGLGDDVRAGEVLPHDQRGGDNEDEALGEPEDGEDFQDDWSVKPNLTFSYGLRYEGQNRISDHADFAPRIAVSWAPAGGKGKKAGTVLRAGYGWFYDRFAAGNVLTAIYENGVNQQNYVLKNPTFTTGAPTPAELAGSSTAAPTL